MDSPDEDVFSLNFATFRYLYKRAEGNIGVMLRSCAELRNIWCVGNRRPLDLRQLGLISDLEVQSPVLDSEEDISTLALSPMMAAELQLFPALPDNWRLAAEDAHNTVSYLADTRRVLLSVE
jgi:hypothetical protein